MIALDSGSGISGSYSYNRKGVGIDVAEQFPTAVANTPSVIAPTTHSYIGIIIV